MKDKLHSISVEFNKTSANIKFKDTMNSAEYAHAIALLILGLNNRTEDDMSETFKDIVFALNNIKGNND